MTGIELYNMYARKLASVSNCACDDWDELEQSYRNVWNALAADVQLRNNHD